MKIIYSEQFKKDLIRLFSSNLIYAIPRWVRDAKMEIKWAWQRVFRGFDDNWYWGLYHMIALTVPKCVKEMRKNAYGYPGKLKNVKEWREILKKIEEGFEAFNKLEDCPYNSKRYKQRRKKFEEGMKLFVKWFENLWD